MNPTHLLLNFEKRQTRNQMMHQQKFSIVLMIMDQLDFPKEILPIGK